MVCLELFFKDLSELDKVLDQYSLLAQQKEAPTVAKVPFTVNLPNKGGLCGPYFREVIEAILSHRSKAPLVAHFSLQYEGTNRGRDAEEQTYQAFNDFMSAYGEQIYGGGGEVLVISGGKKGKLDAAKCLERMAGSQISMRQVGVAFNPYFPNEAELRAEYANLRRKVQTGKVGSIWLQFGTDVAKLDRGVKEIQKIFAELNLNEADWPQVFGSVFLPSAQHLARFRFRPWRGVFCGKEYLEDDKSAVEVTGQLLDAYLKLGVMPLVESALRSKRELELFDLFFGGGACERWQAQQSVTKLGPVGHSTDETVPRAMKCVEESGVCEHADTSKKRRWVKK